MYNDQSNIFTLVFLFYGTNNLNNLGNKFIINTTNKNIIK